MVQTTKRSRCFCTRSQACRGLGKNSVNAYELCTISDGKPCQPCTKATELEARILEAQNALERLLCEEIELRKTINHSHEPFIHHLPLEITAYIFELALPNDWHTLQERELLNELDLSAPLILGAVCHEWRRIAWSLPRLWTYLPIAYNIHMTESASSLPSLLPSFRLEVTAEWLERSGELPLSIGIHPKPGLNNDYYYEDQQLRDDVKRRLEPFIPLLNAHSHRWKNLDLEIPCLIRENLRGNNLGRPIIDRLRVWNDDILGYFPRNAFAMEGIQPAPTYLSFSDFGMVNINWENVTTVDAETLTVKEFCEILRLAAKLQHCSVSCVDDVDRDSAETIFPEVHSALQSLAVPAGNNENTIKLSEMTVSLPSLKSLTLNCFDVPFDDLTTFMDNCGACRLTSLHLEDVVANAGQLVELLRHTPFLEKLYSIWFCNESSSEASNFFQLLGRTSSNPHRSFLPNLKDLQFKFGKQFRRDTCFRWGHVADIFGPIQNIDKEGKRPLASVRVDGSFDRACEFNMINKADLLRFVKIKQTGVELVLRSKLVYQMDILKLAMERHGTTTC